MRLFLLGIFIFLFSFAYAQKKPFQDASEMPSDARLKFFFHRLNDKASLVQMKNIKWKNYLYIDSFLQGNAIHKGVLAHELSQIFPEAVVPLGADYVPNIYESAQVENLRNGLTKILYAPNGKIKVGDTLRFFAGKEASLLRHAVVRTLTATNFTVRGLWLKEDANISDEFKKEVFIYGKLAHDVLGVDYNALFITNMSATRTLARELDHNNTRMEILQNTLATQEKTIAELEDMIQQLEQQKR